MTGTRWFAWPRVKWRRCSMSSRATRAGAAAHTACAPSARVVPARLRPLEQVGGRAEAVGDPVVAALTHDHHSALLERAAAPRAGAGGLGRGGRGESGGCRRRLPRGAAENPGHDVLEP